MQVAATSFPLVASARDLLPACRLWPTTRGLIQFNRVLAWSLVLSPVVQIASGVSFWRGLWFDVALLLVHGGLSLKLFGAPKTAKTPIDRQVLLISGFSPVAVSARNKLLLSGYRVLLGTVYMLGLVIALSWQVLTPWLAAVVLTVGIFTIVRLPISTLGHLYVASDYATRRWGARHLSQLLALAIVVAFVMASLANLLRI